MTWLCSSSIHLPIIQTVTITVYIYTLFCLSTLWVYKCRMSFIVLSIVADQDKYIEGGGARGRSTIQIEYGYMWLNNSVSSHFSSWKHLFFNSSQWNIWQCQSLDDIYWLQPDRYGILKNKFPNIICAHMSILSLHKFHNLWWKYHNSRPNV